MTSPESERESAEDRAAAERARRRIVMDYPVQLEQPPDEQRQGEPQATPDQ